METQRELRKAGRGAGGRLWSSGERGSAISSFRARKDNFEGRKGKYDVFATPTGQQSMDEVPVLDVVLEEPEPTGFEEVFAMHAWLASQDELEVEARYTVSGLGIFADVPIETEGMDRVEEERESGWARLKRLFAGRGGRGDGRRFWDRLFGRARTAGVQ